MRGSKNIFQLWQAINSALVEAAESDWRQGILPSRLRRYIRNMFQRKKNSVSIYLDKMFLMFRRSDGKRELIVIEFDLTTMDMSSVEKISLNPKNFENY